MKLSIGGKIVKPSFFAPCMSCFIILLFLRDFVQVAVPTVLFLAIAFLVAVFASKSDVVVFCFCCIPALNAFQSKYALWMCMILYVIRFTRKKVPVSHVIPILMLVCWEIVHGFSGLSSLAEVVRLFTELLFFCFVMSLDSDELDFSRIVRCMSITAVCVCAIILMSQLKQYGYQVNALFSGVFRLGYGIDETKMSVGFNPNYLAYMCLCCIEGLTFLVYKKQYKAIDVFCITALSVFGLLTMSKKFILCAAAFLLMYMLYRKDRLKTVISTTLIIIAVYFAFKTLFPTAYDALLQRFETGDMSTGRNDIFSFFNKELVSDVKLMFFGVGWQGYGDKLSIRYGYSIPHNGFQELLVMWGLPGFVIFVVFLILVVIRAKSLNSNIRFINFIPLIIMMINVQVSQMVSSSLVSVLIAFVYLCLITDMSFQEVACSDDSVLKV